MDWLEPIDHTPNEWHFCVAKAVGSISKNRHLVKYPNLPLPSKLVPHSTEIPVPLFKGFFSDTLDSKNLFLIL